MSGLIALNQSTEVATLEEKMLKELVGGGNYLPRIQLYTGASGICKSGDFPNNHWGFVKEKDKIEDLGDTVEVIPLSWRFKALDLRNGDVLSYFDAALPVWKEIRALSLVEDSNCMAGTEVLLWLTEKSEFATLFAYNKSTLKEVPKLINLINQAATLGSVFVKNKKDVKKSFQAPTFNESTTPVASLPDADEANEQIERFKSAKDSVVTKATEGESKATSRVQ